MGQNDTSQHDAAPTPPRGRFVPGRLVAFVGVVLVAVLVAGCGASRAFHRGDSAARVGDWDSAVDYYRRAVQRSPNRTDYKIALERAMINASHMHLDQARVLEARGQLDEALREYRRASEYDPPNRTVAAKVVELERRIRESLEAARPKPTVSQLRERARQAAAEPLLNPASREPISVRFNNASIRDILNFLGTQSGINVAYDRDFQDRSYTVQLDGVTLEQALNQILSANQLFYKVINERTIMVIPDTPPKRAQYEEQVIRTFFISHADATELAQLINTIIRVPSMAVQPMIAANKTANTITVRATSNVASIIEKVIEANDNPRAEVVIDVQILEVNRTRAKNFGLNLSDYALTTVFSPEVDPRGTAGGGAGGGGTTTLSTPPFNLNTITRGVTTADFYLAVPSAVMRFLESDSETKLIAKPQLRGAEGQKITLNLGDQIPVPATTFTPVAQGGAAFNPLTSFNYKDVGVNVEMTPRVTFEDEIILDLVVESSTLGRDVNIAGQNLPSFGSRKVNTKLRLRDGESNLLAGLLREDERTSMQGLPGILHIPILRTLFAANDRSVGQTDIVMLLTPRIVRSHELTQQDVNPIYIGTQQNLGLTGAPQLIAAPPEPEAGAQQPPAAAQPGAPGQPVPPAGSTSVPTVPPGSSPIPGTTTLPSGSAAPNQPAQPATTTPTTPGGVPPTTPGGVPPTTPGGVQPAPSAATPQAPPAAPGAASSAQVLVTPPGTEFRIGGGPYTVPLSISGASRVSSITVTLTFNPSALRVRTVQEGSFMRQGGAQATFTHQVDATSGRIDIAIMRASDTTGASGAGLLAAILFDAVGAGSANLTATGSATAPGGGAITLQFTPANVTVR